MPLVVIGLPRILFVHLLSILRQKDTGALFLPVPSFVLPSYRPRRRRPSSSISERATLTSPAKPPRRLPSLPTFDPNCHWSLYIVVVLPSPSLNAKSLVPPRVAGDVP
jgi:hypothetical protein